jgi:ribosomal protein S18 acetylase RimI-like enzyme
VREVRKAGPEHYALLMGLVEKLFSKAPCPYPLSQALRGLSNALGMTPLSAVFLAFEDGIPVGYVWVEALDHGVAWVHHAYSERLWVGKALLDELVKFAKSRGCHKLGGITHRDSSFVKAMARKYGAKLEGYLMSLEV